MEVQKALLSRRSIRSFTSQPILPEDIQEIVDAGMAAPSAVNTQPWYIVAIQSPEKMAELRTCLAIPAARLRPELERSFPDHPDVIEDTFRIFSQLGNAPVCLMVFARKPEKPTTDTLLSVAASMENMLLAAWSKGIGSCWMTGPINFGLSDLVGNKFAPGYGPLISIAPLGYPTAVPAMPPRKADRYKII